MANPIQIFDRRIMRQRRRRASVARADFLFTETADRLIERLNSVNRPFQTVLDFGSRDTVMERRLTEGKQNRRVIKLYPVEDKAMRTDIVADEEFLPFAPNSFDLVVSNLCLHWVNDLPGALVQVRSALKPDGLFLAAMLGGETLYELRDCLMQAELSVTGGCHPRVSPFAELRDMAGLLQRAGFALPVADKDMIEVTYADAFGLMRDLRGMSETSIALDRPKNFSRRAVFVEASRLYQQKYSRGAGRIHASFEVIYLHGWAEHASQQKPLKPGAAVNRLAEVLSSHEVELDDPARFQ